MKNIPCVHRKQKGHCRICGPTKFCIHNRHRSHCRVCNPIGWAKACLVVFKGSARRRGFTPPTIEAQAFVNLMSESKLCVGCGGKLVWHHNKPSPHLHHDHKTGEVYGFCHPMCNQAEGMLSKLTDQEIKNFIKSFFPAVLL